LDVIPIESPSLFPSLDTITGLELVSVDLPRAPLDELRRLPLSISNVVSTSLDPLFFTLCMEPLRVAVTSDFDRPVLLTNPRSKKIRSSCD
jgi:hypothetical protein